MLDYSPGLLFNIAVFSDIIGEGIINVKVCMLVVLVEFYLFMQLRGLGSKNQFQKLKVVDLAMVLLNEFKLCMVVKYMERIMHIMQSVS